MADIEKAKATREYGLDAMNHPNWFDASCIPWISYDSLNIELPDGYLYLTPIVNWGKFREENGYKVTGLSRECYIDGIWNKESVEDWLTEVQLPIE